jgi:BlaI family transcriptional regulator, penicillinase repressor
MSDPFSGRLSKRERQIMEALYLLRAGAVSDVRRTLADPPSYSAVRTTMNILVRKGFLGTTKEGRRYLYAPVISPERARRSAVRHLLKTYFDGSVRDAVMGLVDAGGGDLSEDDYRALSAVIRQVRRKESRNRRK